MVAVRKVRSGAFGTMAVLPPERAAAASARRERPAGAACSPTANARPGCARRRFPRIAFFFRRFHASSRSSPPNARAHQATVITRRSRACSGCRRRSRRALPESSALAAERPADPDARGSQRARRLLLQWYHVGSFLTSAGITGLSHFFEQYVHRLRERAAQAVRRRAARSRGARTRTRSMSYDQTAYCRGRRQRVARDDDAPRRRSHAFAVAAARSPPRVKSKS